MNSLYSMTLVMSSDVYVCMYVRTVDREIFAVKIFSSLAITTKIRHAKI